ncbi:hypothetical protein FB45DRAFT_1034252 [Roridomyces roridus]|uniref:Uncharacterized protein n=1 Tax=Roridomyces roridus TaxID=1738132 RepID=A0AAD7BED3_9AGAR|nr:hypothetical protein FB45DRAFT_1034252 [Roridomyces roridus]
MYTQGFSSTTTAEEVAEVLSDQIRGKNVLITGTSHNSLGFETARVIAKYANLVIITGYNEGRCSEDVIKESIPHANIRPLLLDLSSLDSVRKAAAEVNAYHEPLDVLINNAAAAVEPFTPTTDGRFEKQFHRGHLPWHFFLCAKVALGA